MAFYLRTKNKQIEFLTDEIHKIEDTDMILSEEEYKKFFELQSQGKQYRLKEIIPISDNLGLFDYIEEFKSEPLIVEEDKEDSNLAIIIQQNEQLREENRILKEENEQMKLDIQEIKNKLGI